MTEIYTSIQGVQTPEDAGYFVEELRVRLCRQLRTQQREPDQVLLLPWAMEDLPGTTWRNLHTAEAHTVRLIGPDQFGRLGPDPEYSGFRLGTWHGKDSFQINDWIRVDNLPADVQIAWAAEYVRYRKNELRAHQREARTNPIYKARAVWDQDYLDQALRQLHDLTRQFQLPPINPASIALPGEQLSLFIEV